MVRGLGLFSSTAIVIGSMVGSGIFIVSADIGRLVDSPALLIAAWLVTAVMTIIPALSYGELAAMMPRAGGQYVYLREALGPLWGFLYGWTLFLVIQTGTIAAVAVAFGKYLGTFFPSVSSTHWLWHITHVPVWQLGPMALGNMEIGVNTANLTGILVVVLLTVVNIFGVRLGAIVQDAADGAGCDLDISLAKMFSGYRVRASEPSLLLAERALRVLGYEPRHISSGGGSDANAFRVNGLEVTNLANGTERAHERTERVSATALTDGLRLALALTQMA